MHRFRTPELFLGCFLTIAVFAAGMLFVRPYANQPTYQVGAAAPQSESKEKQSEGDPSGWWSWLSKDAAGFFTFGLVVVGIGQALLFFIQLRFMRRGMDDAKTAADAAKEAADAAKIQAGIARDTLQTMQDTAERQLRAYVGVSKSGISKVETGAPEAVVHIKNFGQTPAYDVQTWIHIWIEEHPLKFMLPVAPASLLKASMILYPGSELMHFMPKEPPVGAENIHLLGTPQGTIYVYGAISYRDAFNKVRTTKFRLMYGGDEVFCPDC